MNELQKLYDRIIQRVNINLRELDFDAEQYSTGLIQPEQMNKFYAFYGISTDHPLSLVFKNRNELQHLTFDLILNLQLSSKKQ